MDCADAKLRMEPYATGNLASPDREEFEKHVSSCEGCRLELDLTRAGAMPATEVGESPPGRPFARPGDPGFAPGTAFGTSSALDEASFADVASQLSEVPPVESMAAEPSLPPQTPDAPPAAAEATAAHAYPDPEAFTPMALEDYSLDELLAAAVPPVPDEPDSTPSRVADPLADALPRVSKEAASPEPFSGARAVPPAGTSWEFEPAEAGRRATPPEGSLFFAEETLARARDGDARRKRGVLRLTLWIAGAVVGLALLLFAGWIAWNVRPSDEAARAVAERYSIPPRHASTVAPAEPPTEGASVTDGSAPQAPPASPEPAAPAEAPAPETANTPSSPPAPAAIPRPIASASTVPPRSPLSDAPRSASSRTRTTSREKPARRAKATSAPVAPSPPPPRSVVEPTDVAPGAAAPTTAPQESGEPATPPAAPPKDAPAFAAPGEPAVARTGSGENGAASPPAASPTEAPPGGGAASDPPSSPPAASETAPPEPVRPIDRLHLATAAAEERGDLNALRNMRETWRNFLRKAGVGPDRSRAKRELADCLWAIQSVTGRRSDQRDALRAYRDYLLNAPAGGADSRSISRTKQLQDALSESN